MRVGGCILLLQNSWGVGEIWQEPALLSELANSEAG